MSMQDSPEWSAYMTGAAVTMVTRQRPQEAGDAGEGWAGERGRQRETRMVE